MEPDGSSKGRLNHHAHVARRGDTRSDLMTFALRWRTRGVNVSFGGLIRAWAGLARSRNERPCLPPICRFLSWGNQSTWSFICLQSDLEDSSQGRHWRWGVVVGGRWGSCGFMLFWSVSATLTVMKIPRPRTCLDKHNSHWANESTAWYAQGALIIILLAHENCSCSLAVNKTYEICCQLACWEMIQSATKAKWGEDKCGIIFVVGPRNAASKY